MRFKKLTNIEFWKKAKRYFCRKGRIFDCPKIRLRSVDEFEKLKGICEYSTLMYKRNLITYEQREQFKSSAMDAVRVAQGSSYDTYPYSYFPTHQERVNFINYKISSES